MKEEKPLLINSLKRFADYSDYSYVDSLNCDPEANHDGFDHLPREVSSGHFVLVNPTPIENPQYVIHSKSFFNELGLDNSLALSEDFVRMFSGDSSHLLSPLRKTGWACGYALSIYGTEYYEQCPFQTGNGYGDGRAISLWEGVIQGRRWEMQLKGGGRTPYCRGGDGRAVLRSSVREFLAQESMHALGIPTTRSLSLYTSKTEKVNRPWYSRGSFSENPDIMISEAVAISTRVASSFIRIGQLELFGRRARKNEYAKAKEELELLVVHLIEREYASIIDKNLSIQEKVLCLAREFLDRFTSLVADWIRVGYCQGNFNSDNCAVGGFTLDYGPFGFCEIYDPSYQPWIGGGLHFSFMNQPIAAQRNFHMFCIALGPLLISDQSYLEKLKEIRDSFSKVMQEKMDKMWAAKLGIDHYKPDLFNELQDLMIKTPVDYTIFFRELSSVPSDFTPLKKSFYQKISQEMNNRWVNWFTDWKSLINLNQVNNRSDLSLKMKQVNPKYVLRERFLVTAYEKASRGEYSLIRELNEVMNAPYEEQSKEIEDRYYNLKPSRLFDVGGVSHMSCSS